VNEPLLIGERVVVRLPTPQDAPALARYFRENAEHLAPFSPPDLPRRVHEEFWKSEVQQIRKEFEEDRSCKMFVFDHEGGAVIGVTSLFGFIRGTFHGAILGYSLAADRQGQGLMYEALRLAIGYAFGELGLHRLMANYLPWNRRSRRVLERLGFVVEGYAREYLRVGERWEDHVLTALTNPDWRPAK
jgi:ribosomal-protein-alanine N-acetyltransferase